MNTREVLKLIRKKYAGAEYALFEEVRNAAGHSANRSADVMVMNLWPSRGLELTGMEIKVSRHDWLKELKSPAKAESFIKYCDRWYLVIGDESILVKGELPPTWGLVLAKGSRLTTLVEAPKLDPVPLSKGIMASMFRRITQGMIHPDDIEDKILEAKEATKTYHERERLYLEQRLEKLGKTVKEFEDASGIRIDMGWYRPGVGDAVKFILDGGTDKIAKELEVFKNNVEVLKNNIDKSYKLFKQL